MNYTEVIFSINPVDPWSDLLAAELGELNFESFENTDTGLKAYIQQDSFDESAMRSADTLNRSDVKINYEVKQFELKNWNEEWESNFPAITVGNECIVHASFHNIDAAYNYQILIDPKMSFGTGHHATTYLMLEHLLELDFTEKTVLDMGCGTAVLAILAAMKGAQWVLAIDNNEWAFENALENVKKNGVSVEVRLGDYEEVDLVDYDVIIANINLNVILEQLPLYKKRLNQKGKLLISGIMTHDAQHVIDEANKLGLILKLQNTRDKWSLFEFEHAK